jgi:REP element-mobilizing transposase RayT
MSQNDSSGSLIKRWPVLLDHFTRSYFACTAGGATIETLKAYVESQSTPD